MVGIGQSGCRIFVHAGLDRSEQRLPRKAAGRPRPTLGRRQGKGPPAAVGSTQAPNSLLTSSNRFRHAAAARRLEYARVLAQRDHQSILKRLPTSGTAAQCLSIAAAMPSTSARQPRFGSGPSVSPLAVASVFGGRFGEPICASNTLPRFPARARATSSRSARYANVVRAVRLAVGAGGADGDLAASAVHAEAVAPRVILARGAIEKVLFFQQAERGAAFAVLRVKALRGDLHLVGVATRCGLRVLARAATLRPP
jgi:hypothetical protein